METTQAIKEKKKVYRDKEWLYRQYITLERGGVQIARLANAGSSVIYSWLNRHNIPIRSFQEAGQCRRAKIDNAKLFQAFTKEGKFMKEIAQELGVNRNILAQRLRVLGVPSRNRSERNHLSRGHHLVLSKEATEFLEGELLGDGSLESRTPFSGCYSHTSKHNEYMLWLREQLSQYGIETSRIYERRQSGEHLAELNNNPKLAKRVYISFGLTSKAYDGLRTLYEKWYPDGEKRVPLDLELTSLIARQWYIGDGSLAHPRNGNAWIILCTQGFKKEEVLYLIKQLQIWGIKSTRQKSANSIYIGPRAVKKFLDWIGPCPHKIVSVYGYKWAIENKAGVAL